MTSGIPRLSLADSEHRASSSAYLHARLRIFYGGLSVFAAALLVVATLLLGFWRGWSFELVTTVPRLVHIGAVAGLGLIYLRLRRGQVSARALVVLDALGLFVGLGTLLVAHAYRYEDGVHQTVALLGLTIVGRAVVVPSAVRTTLLLSLAAPLGLFVLQLAKGEVYATTGVPYPPERYPLEVAFDLTILLIAVAVATIGSRVNFGLRRQVLKAKRLAQYHLDRRIGKGGMGEVYLATHAMLQRPTAIKLISPEDVGEEMVKRFEREVRETSRLSHPNTVSVYDYGRTPEGVFYYAMEYLDGADLAAVVDKTGPMPPARAIHVLRQACASLEEAHGEGLIHRDIKPGNLMLCRSGGRHDVVKVVDFGLVKNIEAKSTALSLPRAFYGTPETVSPEMLRGEAITAAADLYALGVVAYWLLTGKPIFDAKTATEMIGAHLHEEPVPLRKREPSLPGDLEAAILRCLQKEPAERYVGVAEFAAALDGCAGAGDWTQARAAAWWDERGAELRDRPEAG